MRETIKTTNKFFSIMLKLQTHYHVKSYSQKVTDIEGASG